VINFEIIIDTFSHLATLEFIITFIIGIIGGIIIGALPGFSSAMGVALMIPMTFGMEPTAALTMLAAIYTASTYGGSFSAILIHTPGTSASAATAIDGYEITLRGEGYRAIGLATTGSVIGGIIGAIALLLISPPLATLSLRFSSPEYLFLAIFGLTIISGISGDAIFKGITSAAFGLFIATIGVDIMTGISRFAFGINDLQGGFSIIPPMIGLFSLSEVFVQMEKIGVKDEINIPNMGGRFLPTWKEFKSYIPNITISSIIGLFIGILPAAGTDIASWVAYGNGKKFTKTPELYGKGDPHGVIASESANNAGCGGALIPLLTLGIPGSAVAAIFMGGLLIQGMHTGHELFTKYANVTYAIMLGYLLANIVMGIVGWLGAKYMVKIATTPKKILVPLIVVLSVAGTYAVNNSMFEVYFMILFGVLGYFMRKANFSTAAVILGFILGPIIEKSLMQSIVMAKGNLLLYFISRPITMTIIVLLLITIFSPILIKLWTKYRNKDIKEIN
jgi:putative tricarboxylic transport membrane protein